MRKKQANHQPHCTVEELTNQGRPEKESKDHMRGLIQGVKRGARGAKSTK